MPMVEMTKRYDLTFSYEASFLSLLDKTLEALKPSGIPYMFIGGLAAWAYNKRRHTHDIDIFVRVDDANRALECFDKAGFLAEATDPNWIYKAFTKFEEKDAVVDIIFKCQGEIILDDEMIQRATSFKYKGRELPILSPEDLLMIKVIAHTTDSPRHWFDALSIVRNATLDWAYLVKRSARGPRRLLSLLLYAQSIDLTVPNTVIREILSRIGLQS